MSSYLQKILLVGMLFLISMRAQSASLTECVYCNQQAVFSPEESSWRKMGYEQQITFCLACEMCPQLHATNSDLERENKKCLTCLGTTNVMECLEDKKRSLSEERIITRINHQQTILAHTLTKADFLIVERFHTQYKQVEPNRVESNGYQTKKSETQQERTQLRRSPSICERIIGCFSCCYDSRRKYDYEPLN